MNQPSGQDPPRHLEPPMASPCVLVCRIASDGDWCVGCLRTRDEITRWWAMSSAEKVELRRRLATRRPDGSGEW